MRRRAAGQDAFDPGDGGEALARLDDRPLPIHDLLDWSRDVPPSGSSSVQQHIARLVKEYRPQPA